MAENNDISVVLVEDENTRRDFANAGGNEAKRQIVLDEFNKGRFGDPLHIDFFLEQYGKGEILLSSEAEKAKLTQLLQGIDGYKGLTEKANDAAVQEIKAHLTYTTSPVGGMEAMTADVPTTSHTADFGLDQALKEYDRNREKNSFNDLLAEAQKAAVIWQKTGQTDYTLRSTLLQKRDEVKWYQFKRKRQLDKAASLIEPETYWAAQKTGSGSVKGAYYNLRETMAAKRGKKVAKLAQDIAKTTELQAVDASTRWMSTKFFTKAKTKAQLMFRRNPEKLTQKLLNDANRKELNTIINDFNNKLAELPPTAGTKLQQQGLDSKRNNLKNIIGACTQQQQKLTEEKEALLASTNASRAGLTPRRDAFLRNLNKLSAEIKREIAEKLAKDPSYQAYLKLHNGQTPENFMVEQKVTADALMDEVLKAKGLSEEKIQEIKAYILPEKQKRPQQDSATNTNEKAVNEQEAVNETPTNESRKQAPESSNVGNRQPETEVPPSRTYANGDTMLLNITDNKSRYDLVTKDRDGQAREPTVEEIGALVNQLANDGIKEVVLEDSFSKETQQAMLAAMTEKGLTVTNRTEVEQRLVAKESLKEPEQNQPGSAEKDLPSQDKQSEGQTSEPQARPQETQPKNKEPMDIKQILNNAVKNSANQEELMAKLEMVTYVEAGKYNESFTELNKKINDTFGKGSAEAAFLGNMAAAKGLEQDMRTEHSAAENKAWINEEKKIAGINNKDSDKAVKVSASIDLAGKYQGKTLEEMQKDPAYNLLPAYARQGAENLFRLEQAKDVKPDEKAKLRGQILGQIIEGKNQSQHITKEIKQRTVNRSLAASQDRSK